MAGVNGVSSMEEMRPEAPQESESVGGGRRRRRRRRRRRESGRGGIGNESGGGGKGEIGNGGRGLFHKYACGTVRALLLLACNAIHAPVARGKHTHASCPDAAFAVWQCSAAAASASMSRIRTEFLWPP